MLGNANKYFLNLWKDFPGSNFVKYIFVMIGLLCWVEFFYPDFKFASYWLGMLFESENLILGVISISTIFGCLACAFLWFPSYVWSILKELKN